MKKIFKYKVRVYHLVIAIVLLGLSQLASLIVYHNSTFTRRVTSSATDTSILNCEGLDKQRMLDLINARREIVDASPLVLSDKLNESAQMKADHMIKHGYWAHVAPDGEIEPWDFFNLVNYDYRYAGENLVQSRCDEKDAVEAWMRSEDHRDNMLSPKFKELGIGVKEDIIVNHFGTPELE